MRIFLSHLAALPPSAWAVVAALLAVTLGLLTRPLWGRLLGPVFAWDADRLARRRNTFVLRTVFIAALLAALYAAWPEVEMLPARLVDNDSMRLVVMRRFSREFSEAFLVALSSVLLLVTPLYVGGAVSDEKEKRSLDFLLVTQLSNRDIVLGKLGSRVLALLTVTLASLPVLAVTLLFGGVDLAQLLAGVGAAAASVVSLGAFALLNSVLMRRTWAAVALTYGGAAVAAVALYLADGLFLATPISFHWALTEEVERAWDQSGTLAIIGVQLAWYVATHLALALMFVLLARALLRRLADRSVFAAVVAPRPRPVAPAAPPRKRRVYRTRATIPPVGDDPVLWKERYLGQTIAGTVLHNVAWWAFAVLAVILTTVVVINPADVSYLGFGLRGLFVIAGVLLVAGLGLRLAGAFSREREQNTLESLLTIPDHRPAILRAKWRGALLRVRRYAFGLLFVAAALVWTRAASPGPCLLAVLTVPVYAAAVGSLAAYLSLACRTTVRAYMTLIVIVLVLVAGTGAVASLVEPRHLLMRDHAEARYLDAHAQALNPLMMWWRLLRPWPETGVAPAEMVYQRRSGNYIAPGQAMGQATARATRDAAAVTANVLIYLGLARAFWWLTVRRLRREAGHG